MAGIAVLTDQGKVVYQTENWDLSTHGQTLLTVFDGNQGLDFNNIRYSVIELNEYAVLLSSKTKGYIIITPFQGGLLVSYAMEGSEAQNYRSFLKARISKLEGLI